MLYSISFASLLVTNPMMIHEITPSVVYNFRHTTLRNNQLKFKENPQGC